MSSPDLDAVLRCAVEAARIGGEIDREAFYSDRPRQIEEKAAREGFNPVTEVDRASERAIVDHIVTCFPDHAFLGEEGTAAAGVTPDTSNTPTGAPRDSWEDPADLWIIDPIDGTSNYIHGIPHYSVAVGYARNGVMQVAACYDPERNELFTAVRGGGAFCNGEPIHCSAAASLGDAIVSTGFFYERGALMERTLSTIRTLFGAGIHGIRRMGSAVIDLSWVAAGRFDGFFEYRVSPWDYAVASLIVEEAGGRVAATDGTPLTLKSGSVVAGAPALFDELCSVVSGG